jgi:2-polyprenyl-3-methyl-5-hydroxy-6-metoxy-1,4-benzoquinol methylase
MTALSLELPRRVEPELLDELPADDPRARRTRLDLRRINRAMATLAIVLDGVDRIAGDTPPRSILDIGAGDGSLTLRIAKRRRTRWPKVAITLLDRHKAADPLTLAGIEATGWQPESITVDVFDFLAAPPTRSWDIIIANLFVHHFADDALRRLLGGIAERCRGFFCCDPRRSALALTGSHLLGLLGAGAVARADAVKSVHAGFRGSELSDAWPDKAQWNLREYDAGLFSHCFAAVRKGSR